MPTTTRSDEARLVGFITHTGTATAASGWDRPAERKRVRPGLPGSYEEFFHEVDIPRFLLPLRGGDDDLRGERGEPAETYPSGL